MKNINTYDSKKIYLLSLLLFILLNVFFYFMTREYALVKAEERIEDFLLNVKALRNFVSDEQKEAIYFLQKENIIDEEFFNPTLMSSTYVARSVNDEYNQLRKEINKAPIIIRFASDNPRNPINKTDDFESKLLKTFNDKKIDLYKNIIDTRYGKALYYAIPTKVTTDNCMKCHSTPQNAPAGLVKIYGNKAGFYEHKGRIRAILSTIYPLDEEYKTSNLLFYILFISSAIVFFVIVFFFYKYNKILVSSNTQLSQKIEEEVRINREKDLLILQQNKMAQMGEMLENIAHQWKQPLGAIMASSSNIQLQYEFGTKDEKEIEQSYKNIAQNVNYLSNTIDFFRNFFRYEKNPKNINLFELFENSKKIVSTLLIKNKINFINNIDKNINIISLENELVQIFLNLISNAKDALIEKDVDYKLIIVQSKIVDNKIYLEIFDNATGINENIIDKIFDHHFTTKDKDVGSGIGLHMSKQIAKEHLKGDIIVTNYEFEHNNINYTGAKFTLILPTELNK